MKKKLLLLYLLVTSFFAHAQNVGIGTTTPVQKLHVEGATFLNGNVGIGKTSPTQLLDVNGNIRFSGALMPNNSAGTAGQVLITLGAGQAPVWMNPNIKSVAILDFPNTAGQTSSDLTISITGVAIGDGVILIPPTGSTIANSCYTAWASGADIVTVRFNNYSSFTMDPNEGTFALIVIKFY